MKLKRKQLKSILLGAAILGFGGCLAGCESSTTAEDYVGVQTSLAFDRTKPVTITQFTPTSGSVGQQIVIQGTNFGSNEDSLTQVHVTIGGKEAVVVSRKSNALYAYVPSAAYNKINGSVLTGDIEVSVTEGGKVLQKGKAPGGFTYERKMVVGRLCGMSFDTYDHAVWQDGSFANSPDDVSGFKNDGVMQFSPYNHDQLFIVYDQEPRFGVVAHGIQLLDLKAKTVNTILPLSKFSNQRLRTIDFAVDPFMYNEDGTYSWRLDEDGNKTGYADENWEKSATPDQLKWREHLIISADNNNEQYRANSVYIVDRDPNGDFSSASTVRQLANYRQCNGASLHPNGELYFTSYTQGEVIRLDMDVYWNTILPDSVGGLGSNWSPYVLDNETTATTVTGSGAFERLFTVQDTSWEFQIDIHPSGKYAYIVVINRSYILRTDYNEQTKRFSAPYRIAGDMSNRGFQDGVGLSALLRRPYQGTFVKNEEYEAEGKEDIYDFYFCDSENDAIRLLTPEGIVKTYAGGSAATHSDGETYGNENGELRDFARFHRPTGLVNDVHRDGITGENTLIFYILDTYNYSIRTITMEENLEVDANKGN
ncbi:MAG: IPT/TIG domain-containing protein [Bacteroidaceae bacterium]|nr:IPT/TIG domain-containing protein [Bacteroidaceae bacterium]